MELLVRIRDKLSSDPRLNRQLTKRGDVIHAAEDGHEWSKAERENPDWCILKLPDMGKLEAESFLSPEKPADLTKEYVLRKRAKHIDLESLGIPLSDERDDSKFPQLTKDQVLAVEVINRNPMPAYDEIGPNDEVIGPK